MWTPERMDDLRRHRTRRRYREREVWVAGHDASQWFKDCADYLCDGIDDGVQFDAAMERLGSEGGTVVTSGTFFGSMSGGV